MVVDLADQVFVFDLVGYVAAPVEVLEIDVPVEALSLVGNSDDVSGPVTQVTNTDEIMLLRLAALEAQNDSR